jgi:hypothetical protein
MRKIAVIAIAAAWAIQPACAASPSFDCKTERSLLERLVCSDERLAKLDGEMSKAFSAAMKRAGHGGNAALLADQRDFNKDSLQGVEYRLNEASPDKEPAEAGEGSPPFGRRAAILDYAWRLKDRVRLLNALEPGRTGFEGLWRSQSGHARIAKDGAGYKVSIRTSTFGWTRYWCEAEGKGHLEGGSLIVEAPTPLEKIEKLRLTLGGGGLESQMAGEVERGFCPRGGELDKTVHFLPVEPGGEEKDE